MPPVQRDVSDDEAIRRLISLAPKIDAMHSRQDVPYDLPPGCPLVGDDSWTAPYELSHAAWHSVSVAVDHLHAFRMATVVGEHPNYTVTTRPHGVWPLLRGAVENAATTTWLLQPSTRPERVTRLLRLRLQDARYHDEVQALVGTSMRLLPEREKWLESVVAARGLDRAACRAKPQYSEQVRDASLTPDLGLAVWKLLSALAHGQWWATSIAADLEELGRSPDGSRISIRMTTPLARLALYAELATGCVALAYNKWDERIRPYA